MNEIVFPGDTLSKLRSDLLSQSPKEAAAVLLAGSHSFGERTRLLVRETFPVPTHACEIQDEFRVVISSAFIAPLLKRARVEGWSLIFAHTHPFGEGPVRFSEVDDRGEATLFPSVIARAPKRKHGSVVLGPSGVFGRLWSSDSTEPQTADRIVECGRHLRIHTPLSPLRPFAEGEMDRNVRAFGAEGQARISSLRFGIVGLGGTGSFVVQELAHLGATRLVLMDPDQVERSNLNRLVGSTPASVGQPKVDVAERLATAIRPGLEVTAIVGDVLQVADSRKLLACDVIFCCTDSHGSRAVLNQLAYQFMIPVIDMGVVIQAAGGMVSDIAGRAQVLAPGLACLVCNQFFDAEQVRRDFLTPEARDKDPYIVGAAEPQPAVVSLNGTIASMAVTMMLAVVTGLPARSRHQLLIGTRGLVKSIDTSPRANCVVCSVRGSLGRGDGWPMLGRPD